ncbi:MAG: copper chaperone PCu(A)C [Pseudoruegeria sp.]
MSFSKSLGVTLAAVLISTAAFADDAAIMVQDSYARAASPVAKAGAAFMVIMNHSDTDDRLVDVRSDASARVELHTHKDMGEGVMKMMHVEEGFAIPAGEALALERGGNHVMFMGLNGPFEQDAMLDVTLVFENAGEVAIQIPVDNARKAEHGDMKHGDADKDDAHVHH